MSRIPERFEALRKAGRKGLIPYITAGDPHPSLTVPLMHALVESGADIVELGVPFSDPMADGPVIQKAGERALKHGVGLSDVINLVKEFRKTDAATPIVLMGYANPVEAMGVAKFVAAAKAAGVDGVIVVDYPPEECGEFAELLKKNGIDPVFLLAPTSTAKRIDEVARIGSGYLLLRVAARRDGGRAHRSFGDFLENSGDPRGNAASDRRRLRHPRRRVRTPHCRDRRRGGDRQPHHRGDRGRGAGAGRGKSKTVSGSHSKGAGRVSWLQKLLPPKIQRTEGAARKTVPEGLWTKCAGCDATLYSTDLEKNLNVCPKCGHHERLGARPRLDALLDADGRFEIGAEVLPVDPLKFKDSRRYAERLTEAQEQTGEGDAMVVMQGSIKALGVVCAAFEFDFMGGSMGSVVGERFVRGVWVAIEQKQPFICVTASGGARMQERPGCRG